MVAITPQFRLLKSLACFSLSVAIELASSSRIVLARKLSVRMALRTRCRVRKVRDQAASAQPRLATGASPGKNRPDCRHFAMGRAGIEPATLGLRVDAGGLVCS